MKIMGRNVSLWWLLLGVPFALPLLLGGLSLGNDLAGVVGPPAIWHRPSHTPPREDLIGDYVESERHLDSEMGTAVATLSLRADGTMNVRGLPVDESPTYCILSGEGRWGLANDGDAKVVLYVTSAVKGGTCKPGEYEHFELGSRSKPFKLYLQQQIPFGDDKQEKQVQRQVQVQKPMRGSFTAFRMTAWVG